MTNPAYDKILQSVLPRAAMGGAAGAGLGALAAGPDQRLEGALAGGLLGGGLAGATPYMRLAPETMERQMPVRPRGAKAPTPPRPPGPELLPEVVPPVAKVEPTPVNVPAEPLPVPVEVAPPPQDPGVLTQIGNVVRGKPRKAPKAAPPPAELLPTGPVAKTIAPSAAPATPAAPSPGAARKKALKKKLKEESSKSASDMNDPHSKQPAAMNHRENKRRFKAMLPKRHKQAADYAYEEGAARALEDLGLEKVAILGAMMTGARAMAPALSSAGRMVGLAGRQAAGAGRAAWQGGAKAALPGLQTAGRAATQAGKQVGKGLQQGWQAAKPELQAFGNKLKTFGSTQSGAATVGSGVNMLKQSALDPRTQGRLEDLLPSAAWGVGLGGGLGAIRPEDPDDRVRSALRGAIRSGTMLPAVQVGMALGSDLGRHLPTPWGYIPEIAGGVGGVVAGANAGNYLAQNLVPLEER